MPGFVGHTTANTIALLGTATYMLHDNWSAADTVAVSAGIVISTLVLSPDMDLFTSKPMDSWGILKYFWWPYAKLVKHRDRLHTPILGTSVRWLYVLVLTSIAILPFAILMRRIGFGITFTGEADDVVWYLLYLLDIFIGANIADAIHFVLDMTTTGFKREFGVHHQHNRYPLARRRRLVPEAASPENRRSLEREGESQQRLMPEEERRSDRD